MSSASHDLEEDVIERQTERQKVQPTGLSAYAHIAELSPRLGRITTTAFRRQGAGQILRCIGLGVVLSSNSAWERKWVASGVDGPLWLIRQLLHLKE